MNIGRCVIMEKVFVNIYKFLCENIAVWMKIRIEIFLS